MHRRTKNIGVSANSAKKAAVIRERILVGQILKILKILKGMRVALHLCLPNLVRKNGNIILLFIFTEWEKWWRLLFFIWWEGPRVM